MNSTIESPHNHEKRAMNRDRQKQRNCKTRSLSQSRSRSRSQDPAKPRPLTKEEKKEEKMKIAQTKTLDDLRRANPVWSMKQLQQFDANTLLTSKQQQQQQQKHQNQQPNKNPENPFINQIKHTICQVLANAHNIEQWESLSVRVGTLQLYYQHLPKNVIKNKNHLSKILYFFYDVLVVNIIPESLRDDDKYKQWLVKGQPDTWQCIIPTAFDALIDEYSKLLINKIHDAIATDFKRVGSLKSLHKLYDLWNGKLPSTIKMEFIKAQSKHEKEFDIFKNTLSKFLSVGTRYEALNSEMRKMEARKHKKNKNNNNNNNNNINDGKMKLQDVKDQAKELQTIIWTDFMNNAKNHDGNKEMECIYNVMCTLTTDFKVMNLLQLLSESSEIYGNLLCFGTLVKDIMDDLCEKQLSMTNLLKVQ